MHHTKSTVAERPPLSARFIATEWFRGVGYALVTLFIFGTAWLFGLLVIEGAEALISGRAFKSLDAFTQSVLPIAMVSIGVVGAGAYIAESFNRLSLAALLRLVFILMLVVSLGGAMITVISEFHHRPLHCNCLGGPGW
ncbi:hypothetical protein SM14VA4_49650 (plasmid) [Serratia marcescens]|nr:hypothetical protein SM14VA4_49650 [Serratia marcescens]